MGGSSSKMEGAQRSKSAPAAPGQYPNGYTPGPWPGYPEGPVIPAAPKRKNSATKAFKSVLKRPRGALNPRALKAR
ncbi:hypothetical protein BD626DRAFT_478762 [Schizophyllum amplum]|uniref:Uncharacterized protein n=1 Tax=Schizophyllum amplum TaxID=97359 RepID=A0A550CRJ4_9AGAR|nr:hypothetical protein BD626DRAFT_478762 [Auriculariopsis ampla]